MKFPFRHSAPKKYNLILIINQSGEKSFQYACMTERTTAHELAAFGSMEELLRKADKSLPFVIHVRGLGILARSVENAPNYKERLLVSGREDEFYFNSYERSGSVLVSFARKSSLDEFLDPVRAIKGFIWAIYIGPSVLPFKAEDPKTIQSDYVLSFPSPDQVSISKKRAGTLRKADPGNLPGSNREPVV